MNNTAYSDKEILGDALATAKFSTDNYNTFSNECAHENVRSTMMNILNDEHSIQNDVFHMMSSKGYYPTPPADESKVSEAKQRYQSGVK
ncbi:MAG: spore coat protein [Lachnospiraceae bacterium]|nr:spore coat protein [Lachnospiraceae bacterium]MDD3616205.1 spore coat protein [Lachnospiraceae bacterium]